MYLNKIKTLSKDKRSIVQKNLKKLAQEAKKDRFNRLEYTI